MTIETDVQSGWHDAIIELFELDLSSLTGDSGDKFYFTSSLMPDNTKIQWKGIVYEPLPIEAVGFEKSSKGQLPQPELTVANVLGTLATVVNTFNDLVGAKITRRRTLMKYLDGSTSPDPSQEFPDDIFYIERKTAETNVTITWQLASKIDLEGLQLPKRIITQNYCIWKYRGAECGYNGPPIANQFDQPLSGAGASAAGETYINALNAYENAVATANRKQANANSLLGIKNAACDPDSVPSEGSFFLFQKNGTSGGGSFTNYGNFVNDYTFFIQDGDGNNLLGIYDGIKINLTEDPPLYRPGSKARTGRGPGKGDNGTGPVYSVQTWALVSGTPVLVSDDYSPAGGTFALYGVDNLPVLFVNGAIVTKRPSTSSAGRDVGGKRGEGFSPMRFVEKLDYSGNVCQNATDDYNAAVQSYNQAVSAKNTAKAALDAALAALPDNDALRDEDQCGKRLKSCQLRFGVTGSLPFGGFPGANLTR